MNKEELIKIFSAYLPYKIKILRTGEKSEETLLGLNIHWKNDYLSTEFNEYSLEDVKPILYDLSHLTKEIEHKGERFVPMIKLLELQETNHFSNNAIIKNVNSFNHDKVIDCKSKTFRLHPNEMTEHKVRYLVETSNMGTLIYSLTYDEHFDRFHMADETRNLMLGVGHQRQMFEKLYEWHLNVFQIPETEFINKATLNK